MAAPRAEAQRRAVQDNCAERPRGWLCGMAVQEGCAGREAHRTAVQTEGPRGKGRDQLAACRLALSEQDFSEWTATWK